MLTPPTIIRIFSLWKLETFNCILAIVMLGLTYGILQHYNGQRVPDWDIPINLSTLIAFITIIFRTLLVFVLAEIMGQAKWRYFIGKRREDPPVRRLVEASRLHDASQGLFGALRLLPTIIKYPDILMTVMIMIISLGTGSFVQQAIQTRSCQFSTDSIDASLPISRNITSKAGGGKRSKSNLAAAVTSALAPENDEIGSPVSAGCSTGNCTFQNSIGGLYNTFGVCSLCTDTSSLIASTKWTEIDFDLNYTHFMANYTLPNGLSIRAMFENDTSGGWQSASLSVSSSIRPPNTGNPDWAGFANWTDDLDWAGDLVSPEMRALSQWAFANVTVFTSNWLPTSFGYTDYLAVTCTLYPCLRTFNASVKMGKLDEVLLSTDPVAPNVNVAASNYTTEAILQAPYWFGWEPMLDWDIGFQAVQSPCLVNGTVWTEDNTSSTIDRRHLLLLQADPGPSRTRHVKFENITAPTECIYSIDLSIYDMLSMSMITFNGTCSVWSYPNIAIDGEIDCGNSYWLSMFYKDNGITTSDIVERFESFANRFSNKIRMGLLGDPEYVFGQTLQTTICVDIDYRWLAFPTVLAILTSGLFIWTVLRNGRRHDIVWKTSILPFLFYSERFVVQNGEDMSADSDRSSRDAAKEALMDLDQMQTEAKQQLVRFNVFN